MLGWLACAFKFQTTACGLQFPSVDSITHSIDRSIDGLARGWGDTIVGCGCPSYSPIVRFRPSNPCCPISGHIQLPPPNGSRSRRRLRMTHAFNNTRTDLPTNDTPPHPNPPTHHRGCQHGDGQDPHTTKLSSGSCCSWSPPLKSARRKPSSSTRPTASGSGSSIHSQQQRPPRSAPSTLGDAPTGHHHRHGPP